VPGAHASKNDSTVRQLRHLVWFDDYFSIRKVDGDWLCVPKSPAGP
jgi:hypothetical protein